MPTINMQEISKGGLGTACLICGESVPLSEREMLSEMLQGFAMNPNPKICQKCKDTILYMRKKMEKEQEDIEDTYQGEVANDI